MSEQPSPEKRMGKGMLYGFWIVLLLGSTYVISKYQEDDYHPNRELSGTVINGVREITLLRNDYGHYVVDGTINGQSVTFMLDTGATSVSIPAEFGNQLGLRGQGRYQVQTANGVVSVSGTNIDHLSIGPIELRNVRASLNPGMDGSEILLGMNVLKHLDFSQSGRELTLRQHAD